MLALSIITWLSSFIMEKKITFMGLNRQKVEQIRILLSLSLLYHLILIEIQWFKYPKSKLWTKRKVLGRFQFWKSYSLSACWKKTNFSWCNMIVSNDACIGFPPVRGQYWSNLCFLESTVSLLRQIVDFVVICSFLVVQLL